MKNTTVRLDERLYERLRNIAKLECRSVNKQIIVIVREFTERYEKAFPKEIEKIQSADAKTASTD